MYLQTYEQEQVRLHSETCICVIFFQGVCSFNPFTFISLDDAA